MTAAPALALHIPGKPRTQGSMHLYRVESGAEVARYSNDTVNHRNLVVDLMRQQWLGRAPLAGPVSLTAVLSFARPAAHYLPANTRRAVRELREEAPAWHAQAPDGDKCLRLLADAGTVAGVWLDDGQVALWSASKRWADEAGTDLQVWAL